MKLKIQKTDRILALGRSGSGKTTLAKEIVRKNRAYPFFILDPLGVYSDLADEKNVAWFLVDPQDEAKISKIIEKGLSIGAMFVIDEFHSFNYGKYKSLRFLILAGRNLGSGWIAISQFPSLIHKSVIGNANLSFIFSIYEKNAVEYLTHTYEITREEILDLSGYEFYISSYEKILRNERGKPIKFILSI